MVQALSVAPEALQNYTASPAVGLYLPPKNPHHNPPLTLAPTFPLILRLSPSPTRLAVFILAQLMF